MARGVAVFIGAGVLAASLSGLVLGSAPVAAADAGGSSSASADRSGPSARGDARASQREQRRNAVAERATGVSRAAQRHEESTDEAKPQDDSGSAVTERLETRAEWASTVADERAARDRPVTSESLEVNVDTQRPNPQREVEPAAPADAAPADAAVVTTVAPVADRQAPTPRRERQLASARSALTAPAAVDFIAPAVAHREVDADPPRSATLLNVVGSMVINALMGLIHLVDGPPVLPPGSTVTVRTSSLTLPIGKGRTVQADWYFPETVNDTTRLVYLQHGFLASGPMYSYTAAKLAERTNSIVVAPSLSSNFFAPEAVWVGGSTMHRAIAELFVGDRHALTVSARAAAGDDVVLPTAFALVGHSAGGTLVTSTAGFLVDNGAVADLVGIVMLDGVEPADSPLLSRALDKLTGDAHRPIYLISSQRYFWSRGGDMADKLSQARPDEFNGVGLIDGMHIDYMTGGNPVLQLLQYVFGGFSQPRNVYAAAMISAGWINDLFAGTVVNGTYGDPHEEITIETPAGNATAVVLPLGYPARPVWPLWFEALLTSIFDFGGRHIFVYEPLPGYEVPIAETTSAQRG